MIPESTIQEAVELLRRAANPVKIILFGSYALGKPREDSDLDFMVIEREVKSCHMEMVRLRDELSPLRIPVDVLVVSERTFEEWKDAPGGVIREASLDGRIMYEAT